jgi:sensor histidine kinase regulating citrate/malate metabolism
MATRLGTLSSTVSIPSQFIIAAIILPRNLSITVALTAILLFGLLALNELGGGRWLGYYPLRYFPEGGFGKLTAGGLQAKPVYLLGHFAAFFCMVILTHYLTRVIVVRMAVKEMEAAHNNNVLTAIINAMTEGLVFVTCDGRIGICNPAAQLWKDNVLQKNPQLFEQVLLNIFINALDAMEAKQQEQEHILEIKRELENETVEIRIRDTGVGMSQEVCQRAFESFFTTKEIGKGTGLGLFISNNLVTEIGGTIQLKSTDGRGTTVIIRIPVRPKVGMTNMSRTKEI